MTTEVMLVQPKQLLREAVSDLIKRWPEFCLVGSYDLDDNLLRHIRTIQPDVVVMAVSSTEATAFHIIERILRNAPDCGVVVIEEQGRPQVATHLIEAGARGVVTLEASAEELREAIVAVAAGSMSLSKEASRELAMSLLPDSQRSPFQRLTPRELEVTLLMMQGLRMPAMADRIKVSAKTVATYKYRIYDKLGVRSEVDVLKLAMQHGLMPSEAATIH